MTDPEASLDLLQRGHALYGARGAAGDLLGPSGDLRALADRVAGSVGVPGIPSARMSLSVQRLRELAEHDERLRGLLTRLAASHEQGHTGSAVVLDAARADVAPAGDTPLGRREFYRRMAGRVRDQHGHISRSRRHARSLRAALRRHAYGGSRLGPVGGLRRDSSQRDVAATIVREARRRGYSPGQTIAILSAGLQESGLSPAASGGGGAWHGVFQQDAGYAGRDDPNQNISEFFNRLGTKGGPASPDIWKSIFWLQQRPGEASADAAFAHGRQAYLREIQSQLARAGRLYRDIAGARDV
ncbi:hypothetical protein C0J29_31850 (plasmid) [Mycobacterium paragordonae]|uniref:DUF4226 domain-containing protein n=1 Tax=Mycobacterium paragordonae TaxID=1389713 RepID=A0ABQ1CFK9_9MYCO|nr:MULTISPECIES: DUF4226 domain-containing protein [Mycobacterium]AYE99559.1 hypothetical protein C0J29_31850 [Mycobacterium paragordonae]QNI15297.1 DUF4226 domain-containing protein [Mycobacterium kubicae]GFG83224.1 hypothetical protein MPRG_65000 [Mycobacterium paragordonae]